MDIFLPIFLIAYLIGSIPFGLILVRLAGKGDIRKIGSGNIGATNVLRTGSTKLAALTLLLDGGKGAFAVWLFISVAEQLDYPALGHLGKNPWLWDGPLLLAALGVILGHLFPVWLKFKGGKGVATALGVYLMVDWRLGLSTCAVWLITAFIFRYSSLAALLALFSAFALSLIARLSLTIDFPYHIRYAYINREENPPADLIIITFVIGVIVTLRHHANIRRLLSGTEPKIGQSHAAP